MNEEFVLVSIILSPENNPVSRNGDGIVFLFTFVCKLNKEKKNGINK